MQIIDKNEKVTVKLTQHEGRQLRNASYISKRIGVNISDADRAKRLTEAAETILAAANEFTPAQETLDKQDAEQPPAVDETKTPEQPRRRRQSAK